MDQSNAREGHQAQQENNEEAESENETLSMESLLEQSDFTLDLPKRGEIRQGIIASISDNEILVSIGAKSEGVIPIKELEKLSEEEVAQVQVGAEIPVYVLNPESRQGGVLLSIARALEEDDWTQAENLMSSNELFEGKVSGFNKGGLIVDLGRLRAFIPASQVSMSRRMNYQGDTPEQKWGEMIGEEVIARVIEVDRQRRRLILSEKAASQESRESLKDRLLEELKEGEVRKGRVTSLAKFGAFVNINGADGLVHLSEISWERIEDPSELLEVGQEVNVKVISVDKERKRIGLSLRQLEHDPWMDKVAKFKVGHLVEGTITRLTKFGAFARIDDNLEGLIHVSELSDKRVEHPKEVVTEDDQITLRIIKVDEKRRRIGLSLRKVSSGAYSDIDWEMTLAEIDQLAEQEETGLEDDPRVMEGVSEDASSTENELSDEAEMVRADGEGEDKDSEDTPQEESDADDQMPETTEEQKSMEQTDSENVDEESNIESVPENGEGEDEDSEDKPQAESDADDQMPETTEEQKSMEQTDSEDVGEESNIESVPENGEDS